MNKYYVYEHSLDGRIVKKQKGTWVYQRKSIMKKQKEPERMWDGQKNTEKIIIKV